MQYRICPLTTALLHCYLGLVSISIIVSCFCNQLMWILFTDINYFYCVKIVEILKETEADTKNLFGRYGSQRMKDWQEIIRLYEKDNVYLAEAAQMLMRNVNYEVPSIKKQIQKLEQSITVGIHVRKICNITNYYCINVCIQLYLQELEKKEAEYKKSENIARSEYNTSCKQLGITGYSTFRRELMEKVKELPEIYQKIAEKTKSLDKVVEFYGAFVEFTFGQQYDGSCVPMIKYVIGMLLIIISKIIIYTQ